MVALVRSPFVAARSVDKRSVTRHPAKRNGGLRRSLSSGRALRGPGGFQSARQSSIAAFVVSSRR